MRLMDKNVAYLCNGILLSNKKKNIHYNMNEYLNDCFGLKPGKNKLYIV